MRVTALLPFLSLALGSTLLAQGNFVYFVPTGDVEGWCHAGSSCCVQEIGPRDIAVVEKVTCQDCAIKLAPELAWNTLAGDDDGDALYYKSAIFGEIDAMMMKRLGAGPPNMRQFFISVKQPLGSAVSGTPRLRPGDVAAIVRNAAGDGQVEHFLRAEQVRSALGITAPLSAIDVDAIATDDAQNVYLSLDADIGVNLLVGGVLTPMTLYDGSIAVIPAASITYNARGNVSAVVANSAMILLSEGQVNNAVVNSGVTNHAGAAVLQIGDLDALEADDTATGPLRISWGGVVHSFSHLAFGGENLTGLAVLSTQAGGSVYSFGTVPCCLWLARSNAPGACLTGPSTGFEMGVLLPGGGAVDQSLNALAIRHDPLAIPFFIDTCTPIVTTPGSAQVGVSGGSTPTAIIFSFGPGVAGGVATSTPMPWPVLSHPDLYTTGMITSLVLGGTSITLSFPALPPINLVMQAVTIDPVALQPVFSTPGTLVLN